MCEAVITGNAGVKRQIHAGQAARTYWAACSRMLWLAFAMSVDYFVTCDESSTQQMCSAMHSDLRAQMKTNMRTLYRTGSASMENLEC